MNKIIETAPKQPLESVQAMQNPLSAACLDIINQHPDGISEFELIKALEAGNQFALPDELSPNLRLFKSHFLVMNGLYELQQRLYSEKLFLSISPLEIKITVGQVATEGRDVSAEVDSKLSEYYLDWANYDETGDEQVEQLLNSFWQRFLSDDKKASALERLGLAADADWQAVKLAYRRLVKIHHPDHGGDAEHFVAIFDAYQVLKRCY